MRHTLPRTGSAKTRGPAWPIFRRAAGPFVVGTCSPNIAEAQTLPGAVSPATPEILRAPRAPGAQAPQVGAGFGVTVGSLQALVSTASSSAGDRLEPASTIAP